jgi:hypothetical protein
MVGGKDRVTQVLNEPTPKTRQDAFAARDVLSEFSNGTVDAVMLIFDRADDLKGFAHLQPTVRAKPQLNAVIQRSSEDTASCELIDYGPAATCSDGEAMWIGVDQVTGLAGIIEESIDAAGVPVFDPKKSKLASLRFVTMSATVNGKTAIFIEYLKGRQVIAQTKNLSVVLRKGILDVPPDGQLALIGQNVSVIVVDGVALFRDRKAFQQMFGFLAELRAQAEATFAVITADLRISGFDAFQRAAISSPQMLGKMASIQRKLDGLTQYKDALTMPKLLAFIGTHPMCAVDVIGTGEAAQLVFQSDVQHRFKILKLLDDDYLRSDLTEFDYEANSKGNPIPSTT